MPLFARKFIVDFAENALAGIFVLALAFPASYADLKAEAAVVGFAILGALISAARRAAPGFLAWLAQVLNVSQE
jgi:hypothetical protein